MIETNKTPICESGENALDVNYRHMLFTALWMIPGVTLIIFLIYFTLGSFQLSQTGIRLLSVFIYCACIGLASMVTLTLVSIRYAPKFPRTLILIQAVSLAFTATVGSLAADGILWSTGIVRRGFFWGEFRESLPFSIVITLLIGLGIATYKMLSFRLQMTELELRTQQMEHERANKLLAEAQLSSLESRIHPHFLFNTLNSIAALIPSDPQRAEDTVAKLASLLRFSLNAQHNGLVPLEQELKVVRDYLEIEATRFGQRLRYEILVPDTLFSFKVPPLSLQTLVENSMKHVAAVRSEGVSIQVRGSMEKGGEKGGEQGRLSLEVIDDGPGFSLSAVTPEHGLGNLVARLELLFGNEGRLDVLRERENTVVRIALPAES